MNCVTYSLVALLMGSMTPIEAKLRDGDCDEFYQMGKGILTQNLPVTTKYCQGNITKDPSVCIKFLTKFEKTLTDDDRSHPDQIKKKLLSVCKTAKGKDNRFCYYIGGTPDAATMILNEVTKPMKNFVPPEKICEKLKGKDSQICDLQYEQKIDVRNVDLKKMRVKDLRKILNSWDEECKGCIEKSDFIQRIEELKDKHTEL